jgi:hypothetical protein
MIDFIVDAIGYILMALSPFIGLCLMMQIREWLGTKPPPQHYDQDDHYLPPGA